MFFLEVFICKLVSINTLATSAIVVGEVTTLTHESWDNSVEAASFVTISFFASAECSEVFRGFGNDIWTEFHDNPTNGVAASGHIEVNFAHFVSQNQTGTGISSINTCQFIYIAGESRKKQGILHNGT